jgi:hypothetical protein
LGFALIGKDIVLRFIIEYYSSSLMGFCMGEIFLSFSYFFFFFCLKMLLNVKIERTLLKYKMMEMLYRPN